MRGKKYPYYFHPEIKTYHELAEFGIANPHVDVFGLDNAEYEMVLSREEQISFWKQNITMIMKNTRWVLDNLEELPSFTVGWNMHAVNGKDMQVGKPPEETDVWFDKMFGIRLKFPKDL